MSLLKMLRVSSIINQIIMWKDILPNNSHVENTLKCTTMKNISLRNKKYLIILFQMKKNQVKHLLSIPFIFTYMQIFKKLKDIKYLDKKCFHK